MRQIAIRVANAAIFVLCASLSADVFNQISADALAPSGAPAIEASEPRSPNSPPGRQVERIIERNLFGAQIGSEAAEPVAVEEPTVETKLPLKLLGTVPSNDPTLSSAAIQDQGSRKHEVVRIGDTLRNYQQVEVVGIERQRIVLRNGERNEELKLREEEDGGRAAPVATRSSRSSRSARTARSSRSSRSRSSRSPEPAAPSSTSSSLADRLQELRADAESRGGSPRSAASLFSQARILPKYEDGQMIGMEISGIKEGSFYQALGIPEGSVVTAVNGVQITSAADTAKVLNMLTKDENITIDFGNGTQSQYNLDQIESAIEGLQ